MTATTVTTIPTTTKRRERESGRKERKRRRGGRRRKRKPHKTPRAKQARQQMAKRRRPEMAKTAKPKRTGAAKVLVPLRLKGRPTIPAIKEATMVRRKKTARKATAGQQPTSGSMEPPSRRTPRRMKLSQLHEPRQTAMSRMGIGSSIGMAKRHTTTTSVLARRRGQHRLASRQAVPTTSRQAGSSTGMAKRHTTTTSELARRRGQHRLASRQAVPTTSQQAGTRTTPVGRNIMTTRETCTSRTLTRARRRGLGRPSWATSTRPQLALSGGRTSTGNGTRAEHSFWWMTQGGGVEVATV